MNNKRLEGRAERWLPIAALILCALAFVITAYRALTTGITDDEASSYVLYAKNLSLADPGQFLYLFRTAIANHQWLNTILMHVADQIAGGAAYSVPALRIPVLLTFAVYLGLCFQALREHAVSAAGFVALVTCYYMNEFFGLARGYGYSAMFVMLALFLFHRLRQGGYTEGVYVLGILAALFFAGFANTVTLIIYPSIGLMLLIRLVQHKTLLPLLKRHAIGALLFVLGAVFLVSYHMGASTRDQALYTGKEGFLRSTVLTYFRMYFGEFRGSGILIMAAALLLLAGCVLACWFDIFAGSKAGLKQLLQTHDFTCMLLIFVVVSVLMGPLFGKGYITGRTAIPFLPMLLMGLDELLRARILNRYVQAAMILVFALLLIMHINLTGTTEWPWDYGQEEVVQKTLADNDGIWPEDGPVQDFSTVFYVQKYYDENWMPAGYVGPEPIQ